MDPSKLGKHYRRQLAKDAKAEGYQEPLGSEVEARFVVLLKAARVPKWHRPASGQNDLARVLGTPHRPDFMWCGVEPRGQRKSRLHLAVFIDGRVHGLPGRLGDTLRCVNLCGLLPDAWTVFRFADDQLEVGAKVVADWHAGRMLRLVKRLREGK